MKMKRLRMGVQAIGLVMLMAVACGGDEGPSCDLPANWSAADSGGLCQVNLFDPDRGVYCSSSGDGYACTCDPNTLDELEFTSTDFCDLDGEERACAAIDICGW